MNDYGSVCRTFRAHNIASAVLAPDADLSVTFADDVAHVVNRNRDMINPEGNVLIKSAGLFCNFADGLVFKNPYTTLPMQLTFQAGNADTLNGPYNGTVTQSSRDIDVTDATGLSAGDYILIHFNNGSTGLYWREYNIIESIAGSVITLRDYPMFTTTVDADIYKIDLAAVTESISLPEIKELNYLYPVDKYSYTASYLATSYNEMIVTALPFVTGEDYVLDFLTKSISTAYTGDTADFSLVVEIEHTRSTQRNI